MEKISIEGTSKTPAITFDTVKCIMEIKGRSTPENSTDFYMPIVDALKRFPEKKCHKITANFQLEYFNTSSSKCILDILKTLGAMKKIGVEVVINWYYEDDDDDMFDSGENYQQILSLPFNMIPFPPA